MRAIATEVAWLVCVSVGHVCERCKDDVTYQDATYQMGVEITHGNRQFWGMSGPFKSIAGLCQCSQQKGSSFANNGMQQNR